MKCELSRIQLARAERLLATDMSSDAQLARLMVGRGRRRRGGARDAGTPPTAPTLHPHPLLQSRLTAVSTVFEINMLRVLRDVDLLYQVTESEACAAERAAARGPAQTEPAEAGPSGAMPPPPPKRARGPGEASTSGRGAADAAPRAVPEHAPAAAAAAAAAPTAAPAAPAAAPSAPTLAFLFDDACSLMS